MQRLRNCATNLDFFFFFLITGVLVPCKRFRIYALATPAGAREWRRLTLTRQRALLATMHGRSGLPSNELGTPAAQPEPSAARSADDKDLPVITLSVPYPFGAPTDLITYVSLFSIWTLVFFYV